MQVNIFFYGFFMDAALLQAEGFSPENSIIAELHGYSLRIGNRATLVPDANKTVYGSLMSMTHDEIDKLYSVESLKAYRYVPVIVHTKDGKTLPALCFILPDPPADHERNEEYARKLKSAAIRCGLPEEYVNAIS